MRPYLLIACLILLAIACAEEAPPKPTGTKPRVPRAEYSMHTPGEWHQIAGEHAPRIRKESHRGEAVLVVSILLEKPGRKHYIEAMGIMDEEKKVWASYSLQRKLHPTLTVQFRVADLPAGKKLKVYSKCNLHDMWTEAIPNEWLH